MTPERKTYRTAAYRVQRDGQEHVIYWTLFTSGLDADKSFVTEHDLYKGGSMSKPVREHLPHREAFRLIAEIDREAAAKHPLADNSFLRLPFSDNYSDAIPWQNHPAHLEEKLDVLRRLKAKRPGFGLK